MEVGLDPCDTHDMHMIQRSPMSLVLTTVTTNGGRTPPLRHTRHAHDTEIPNVPSVHQLPVTTTQGGRIQPLQHTRYAHGTEIPNVPSAYHCNKYYY